MSAARKQLMKFIQHLLHVGDATPVGVQMHLQGSWICHDMPRAKQQNAVENLPGPSNLAAQQPS